MRDKAFIYISRILLVLIFISGSSTPGIIIKSKKKKVKCKGSVAGIWEGMSYTPSEREWYLYTLIIRPYRPGTKQLRGKITVHIWSGSKKDRRRFSCGHKRFLWFVSMKARGSVNGVAIKFNGYGTPRSSCRSRKFSNFYRPDSFHGIIDFNNEVIKALNNDGGMAVNERVVFRRIRCFGGKK